MLRAGTAAVCALALAAAAASTAGAATQRVLVLTHGHVHARMERFAGATELSNPGGSRAHRRAPHAHRQASAAARSSSATRRASAARSKKRAPHGRYTRQAIDKLLASGQIDQATRDQRQAQLRSVLRAYKKLAGTRQTELGAVIDNADAMSKSGDLTSSRLAPVFATLRANADWWTNGTIPVNGQRISIAGSPLIWQYYRGQGIELQMLANFGRANALFAANRKTALRELLDALLPLAADRGGWPAWEYYFKFGGGKPPWTSSISQGTAVQVLARSAAMLNDPSLVPLGAAALTAFEVPAPAGVRDDTGAGPLYVIYSFHPGEHVINAHLQALVGLYDFAQITGDARAQSLFQQGDATAQALLPSYDTGKWSMYDQSHESDLSYHKLVMGFLKNLCGRTQAQIYCQTYDNFRADLKTDPVVTLAPQRIRAGAPARLTFSLDKISRVGLTVKDSSGRTVFGTSAIVGRGDHFYSWSRPARPGTYTLSARATDLAGNRSAPTSASLRVLRARRHHH